MLRKSTLCLALLGLAADVGAGERHHAGTDLIDAFAALAARTEVSKQPAIDEVLSVLGMDTAAARKAAKTAASNTDPGADLTSIPLPDWVVTQATTFKLVATLTGTPRRVRFLILQAPQNGCIDAAEAINRLRLIEWPEMVRREDQYRYVRWDGWARYGGVQLLTRGGTLSGRCLDRITFTYLPIERR